MEIGGNLYFKVTENTWGWGSSRKDYRTDLDISGEANTAQHLPPQEQSILI